MTIFVHPHRLLHTLPIIGEIISDESCHFHRSKLRMLHHSAFCKLLKCPNYAIMIKYYKDITNKK